MDQENQFKQFMKNMEYPSDKLKSFMHTQYYTNLKIGESDVRIMFDTGSSNVFVTSSKCSSLSCYLHYKYNSSKSKTYEKDGRLIDLQYGSGGIYGFLSSDMVEIYDGQNVRVTFAEVTKFEGFSFYVAQFDGLIGLAFQNISKYKVPTILQQMKDQKIISSLRFSIYLGQKQPYQIIFGGINQDLINKDTQFKYVKITKELWFFIDVQSLMINNNCLKITGGIVDSGTSVMVGSPGLVDDIKNLISVKPDCSNLETLPDIEFTIEGQKFLVKKENYVIKITVYGECMLGFIPMQLPEQFGDRGIILGDLFHQQYYVDYDLDQKRIGFAQI